MKKTKSIRRVITMVLSLIMIIGLLPISTFAKMHQSSGNSVITSSTKIGVDTIAAADQNGDNALKKVIICSKGASTPDVEVNAVCEKYYGTVTGSGSYTSGDTVTLTATAEEDTNFEYWIDTSYQLGDEPTEEELKAAIVSYDAEYTFEATENITLEAVFSVPVEISIVPMLIAGTDDESLMNAEWLDQDGEFDTITPDAEQISLPGEIIEDIITIGDQQYKFAGIISFGYDEQTDTETVELKDTTIIDAMPLYGSAEFWNWFVPISDGIYVAYMEYTPDEDEPQDPTVPGTPDKPQDPTVPKTPNEPQDPTVPKTPNEPQDPTVPKTPNEPQDPTVPETPDDIKTPGSPDTSDNSNLWMWFSLLFISGAGILAITLNNRKRNSKNK